jgi:hypothetical protein
MAAKVAICWKASEIGRGKRTTRTVVKGTYRIGGRGVGYPLLPHPAIAPARCDASEFFWGADL